jgi:hypothetical protein
VAAIVDHCDRHRPTIGQGFLLGRCGDLAGVGSGQAGPGVHWDDPPFVKGAAHKIAANVSQARAPTQNLLYAPQGKVIGGWPFNAAGQEELRMDPRV